MKRDRIALLLAALACGSSAAADDRASIQAACFPPQSLRAVPHENIPRHRIQTYDKQPTGIATPEPRAQVAPGLRGAIRRVALPPGDKSIALTFDLCEQRGEVAGYDGAIFDTLRRENVKATLFAGGKWLRSHAGRAEQLLTDPLFEFANHSATHRNLRLLSPSDAHDEIVAPERDFALVRDILVNRQCTKSVGANADAIQKDLKLFRFPFGACNRATLDAANNAGYLAIQWSLSPGDPDPHQSARAIAATVLQRIRPGDIVIMHANGRGWNSAKALPDLIAKLKQRGFTFLTVSELIARGQPVVATSCYDNRPGDTDRYDFRNGPASARQNPDTSKTATKTSQRIAVKKQSLRSSR